MPKSQNSLKAIGLAVTTALVASFATPALAEWPEKPIKITIPWAAGAGAIDQMTRQLQKSVSDNNITPEPLTIFNIGGPIPVGLRQAKDDDADGYNFVVMNTALLTLEATGKIDFGYRDFEPVARVANFCLTQTVHKDTGINSIDELLDKAAAEPDTLIFGANLGALNHIFGVLVQDLKEGAKFRFVQTGGDAGTFPEMKGGRVQVAGFSSAGVTSYAMGADGKLDPESPMKILAYAGPQRHENFPDVPTFHELGYDLDYCVDGWYLAPKGTPQEAIDGFAAMVEKSLEDQGMKDFLKANAMSPAFLTGDALKADFDKQYSKMKEITDRLAAGK